MEECARMGCDKPAVALLSFSPQQAKAWLYDLHEPDSTGGIALCRRHANGTVVPMSWQLVDARDPAWPGPPGENPPVDSSVDDPSRANMPSVSLPSDSVGDEAFAALRDALPVLPKPYVSAAVSAGESHRDADLGLFELPLSDAPAVTPHPGY